MTSVVRFNRSIGHKDVWRPRNKARYHLTSHFGFDGWRGWAGSDHLYMSGENLPYQVKSFFSTDKSILLTLIENLYFTLLLIRQKMDDRDCLDCIAI